MGQSFRGKNNTLWREESASVTGKNKSRLTPTSLAGSEQLYLLLDNGVCTAMALLVGQQYKFFAVKSYAYVP